LPSVTWQYVDASVQLYPRLLYIIETVSAVQMNRKFMCHKIGLNAIERRRRTCSSDCNWTHVLQSSSPHSIQCVDWEM